MIEFSIRCAKYCSHYIVRTNDIVKLKFYGLASFASRERLDAGDYVSIAVFESHSQLFCDFALPRRDMLYWLS